MAYPVHYVPAGDVLPIFFSTFDGGTGASITMTGLAVTDIEIYKDGSTTQRASDAGYTLLDTDGIDFDSLTGIHGFSIDTGDNTDASFYTVGSWFHVVVSAVTVDAQTVSFVAAAFRIMAAEGVAGVQSVNTTHASGTAWGSGAITAASIASDAITAAKVAADVSAEIADGVWDEALSGHATAGSAGEALSAAGTAGDPWTTALPGAYGAGTAGAIVGNLVDGTFGIVDRGTAQSATGTTLVLRSAAGFANDELIGATIVITGGTGVGQSRIITDYVGSTDTATVDTWTTTPSGTITYVIVGTPPASATSVPAVNLVQVAGSTTDVSALATNVAAILVDTGTTLPATLDTIDNFLDTEIAAILADTNELQTDWANGGRLDLLLDGAASAGDPWTTALPGAYGSGTAGKIIGDNINATISSRASQTSVDTVDDLLDTEVAAIKTVVDAVKVKTDQLAFTAANKVDANVLNVNSQSIGASKPYDTAS
jgi:hypothetical protein